MGESATPITASILYDLVQCPHRVTMDLFEDPARRDRVSAFVQMLWERGALYEQEVVAGLRQPILDLSALAAEEKKRATLVAMDRGEALIYSGRICQGDLLGDPDILRREGIGYVAGDIKSGAGEEGGGEGSEGRPKKHYAVQLALYTDVLEKMGKSAGRRAFVWDIHGDEVQYDFTAPQSERNPRTLWQEYEEALALARGIVARARDTTPAYGAGTCKFCVWYSSCLRRMEASDDLTLIPELGRSRRDGMLEHIATISQLATSDVARFLAGRKTTLPGIGPSMLERFIARAKLISSRGQPYLREPIGLQMADRELFLDVEVDPMRDVCYLHGFVDRRGGDNATERYVGFFAEAANDEAERRAFAEAWAFLQQAKPFVMYIYSKYERTQYRRLRAKYPEICSEAEVEALFDPLSTVDLYFDVVAKATEWPTRDYSLKTLAGYLGFAWRDPHPSGAESIEWFHRWIQAGDPLMRSRILEYNEDDCRATRVLLDGIRSLASS